MYRYDIMLLCWEEDPNNRPTFVELRNKFDIILSKQQNFNEHYIDLSVTLTSSITTGADSTISEGRGLEEGNHHSSMESITSKCSNNDNNGISSSLQGLSNVYVDSPTHYNERPNRLSLPDGLLNPNSIGGMTLTPGGISLPLGYGGITATELLQ